MFISNKDAKTALSYVKKAVDVENFVWNPKTRTAEFSIEDMEESNIKYQIKARMNAKGHSVFTIKSSSSLVFGSKNETIEFLRNPPPKIKNHCNLSNSGRDDKVVDLI